LIRLGWLKLRDFILMRLCHCAKNVSSGRPEL